MRIVLHRIVLDYQYVVKRLRVNVYTWNSCSNESTGILQITKSPDHGTVQSVASVFQSYDNTPFCVIVVVLINPSVSIFRGSSARTTEVPRLKTLDGIDYQQDGK